MTVYLRKATAADALPVFNLSNHQSVRVNSINQEPITWENHLAWFTAKLTAKNYEFYIAEDEDKNFIGQLRYEISNDSAVISISISPDFQGKGLSSEILITGSEVFFAARPEINQIIAWIRHANLPSQKAFTKAGFKLSGEKELGSATFAMYLLLK
jgi:UDP-2,4-diacetamido-2,4,6-trideoxy-beta-L-altropyranose hydrolase